MDTFLDVIEDLGKGRVVVTVLGDGSKHHEWHEPLIAQLRDAVAATLTEGSGSAKTPHRIPIDPSALELYQAIERDISESYFEENLGVPGLLPEENLLALYAQRWQDDGSAEPRVREWRSRIINLFDPVKPWRLEVPCPVCGAKTYTTEAGDVDVWPVAIQMRNDDLNTAQGRCLNPPCGAEWDSLDALRELGGELREKGQIVPCPEADDAGVACIRATDHHGKHRDAQGYWNGEKV
jgi:hypothetical protein